MDTTTSAGWVVLLPTGRALPDPERDDDVPAVFTSPAAANEAAATFATEAADAFDVLDMPTRIIPAADYHAPADELASYAPADMAAVVRELSYTDPAPAPRVTRVHAVMLPTGSLYADGETLALGRSYTSYPDPADAAAVADRLTTQARDRGLSGWVATVVSRDVVTTWEDWRIAPRG